MHMMWKSIASGFELYNKRDGALVKDRTDARRKVQSESFQCTIPISVFEQSDLLLRYSTVTNLFE